MQAFYPDGNAGQEQRADDGEEDRWAGWNARKVSKETNSTNLGGNQNQSFGSDSGGKSGDFSSHSGDGDWFWTPQMWVWGRSVDDGVKQCIQKGWITPDSAFCAWWVAQTSGESQAESELEAGAAQSFRQRSWDKGECQEKVQGQNEMEEVDSQKPESTSNSSQKDSKPFTGKEFVPSHDGVITMREYVRRVKLFESNTAIDPSFRAGKLVEKLTGQAWECCETLDVSSLRCPQGVQLLLDHLWAELEPLEHLRISSTLSEFYQKFRRPKGQQFTAYDTAFRGQCLRLKECNAPLTGTVLAYWFLEKASLSEELKRQVLSAAGGVYDYHRLRQALVAIVPRVSEDERNDRKWYPKNSGGKGSNRVHAVDQEGGSSDDADGERGDLGDAESAEAERLEKEAAVLMTHAARKRAAADKNRGFKKDETEDQRAQRIKEMKARMPCAACKSHGHTRYGHWHEDPECPYHNEAKPKAKPVFVVGQEDPGSDDSDHAFVVHVTHQPGDDQCSEDFAGHVVSSVVLATATQLRSSTHRVALADTCCARTVSGAKWMCEHLDKLAKHGIPYMVTDDEQPFRFGDGPCVKAFCAVIMPLFMSQTNATVLLRVSVIEHDVPLLVSSKALRSLGAVVDFGKEGYYFKTIDAKVAMIHTNTGHIGFHILEGSNFMIEDLMQLDWTAFAESNHEVAYGKVLEEMGLEKLRLIYQTVKPKAIQPLPTNWRRFSKVDLQKLFVEKAVPWYGIPLSQQMDHLTWSRDRLVVELANYAEEVRQEAPEIPAAADPDSPPLCPKCNVKMVERVNRMDGNTFWGCLSFPHCRATLGKNYGALTAAEAQMKMAGEQSLGSGSAGKAVMMDNGDEMNGMVRRAVRTPVPSSEVSWDAVTESPKNLTASEKQLIKDLRKNDKN
eukprot:s1586_g18.t1